MDIPTSREPSMEFDNNINTYMSKIIAPKF